MKVSDQEKRNVWLSIYSAAVSGFASGVEEIDQDEVDDMTDSSADIADAGLSAFEETFVGGGRRDREEEPDPEEPEVEETRERRRPRSRRSA